MNRKLLFVFLLLLIPAIFLTGCEAQTRADDRDPLLPQTGGEGAFNQGEGSESVEDENLEGENREGQNSEGDTLAAQDEDDVDEGEIDLDDERFRGEVDEGKLYWVEDLIGYTLETEGGQDVGVVDSILIHPQSGKIHYLVLDVEDDLDLDLEDEYVLVPWNAVARQGKGRSVGLGRDNNPGRGDRDKSIPPGHLPPPDEREPMECRNLPPGHLPPPEDREELCLDYTEGGWVDDNRLYDDDDQRLFLRFESRILSGGPSFSDRDLDDLDEEGWEENVDRFWRGHIEDLPNQDNRSWRYIRVGEEDFPLVDRDGDRIGEVNGMLFHIPSGQINYAVISTGSFLNTRDGYSVVRYSRLNWLENENAFALSVDADRLERLPAYDDEDDLPVPRDQWKNDGDD